MDPLDAIKAYENYCKCSFVAASRIVQALVGPYFDADEFLQIGMIVVWKNLPSYREEKGSFPLWVEGVLRRCVVTQKLKELERRSRWVELPVDLVDANSDSTAHPEELERVRSLRRRLWKAMQGLTRQEFLVLATFIAVGEEAGTTTRWAEAVSERLGIKPGTARTAKCRAIRRLRAQLLANPLVTFDEL